MRLPTFTILIAAFSLVGCRSPCFQGACGIQGNPFNSAPINAPSFGRFSVWNRLKSAKCSLRGKFSNRFQSTRYPSVGGYSPFWDKLNVKKTAKLRGDKALWRLGWQSKDCFSSHFRSGFRQAYRDISRGGSGQVPAIPPEKYWSAYYRTERGRAKAQDWFEGYRVGAGQAGYDRLPQFNRIASSGVYTSGRQHSFRGAAFNHSFPFETQSSNFAPAYPPANSPLPMHQMETRGSVQGFGQPSPSGMPGAIAPIGTGGGFGHSFQSGGGR